MIKWVCLTCSPLLTKIFNACFKLSYFPDIYKIGKPLTIPKPGKYDLLTIKHLRPITLLSDNGKVFERVLLKILDPISLNWFDSAQLGFTKGFSTEIALLKYLYFLESNIENFGIASLKLDISGAFDKTWHPTIINNSFDFECPQSLIKLIANFLKNRSIDCKYGFWICK